MLNTLVAKVEDSQICVVVATHKPYRMPKDPMYMPLFVGKALRKDVDFGFMGDNTGDNISSRNSWYSELTGLYWLWKNVDVPYLGLVHYRRHFATGKRANSFLLQILLEKLWIIKRLFLF